MKFRVALAALCCLPALAVAQAWPSRPITIIVTTSPGTGIDVLARAAPDGYTLLMSPTSFATNLALDKAPFDPIKSFTPVALLAMQGLNPLIGPPSKMGDLLKLDLERWPRVVQAAGIKGE